MTSLRHFFPNARWAFVLTSWTVEEGRSVRSSECPFSKATFISASSWDVLRYWQLFKTSAMDLYSTLLHTLSPSQARTHDQARGSCNLWKRERERRPLLKHTYIKSLQQRAMCIPNRHFRVSSWICHLFKGNFLPAVANSKDHRVLLADSTPIATEYWF